MVRSIKIEYAQDKSRRSSLFYNRRAGILKKSVELAKLCGIKICVVFTDLKDNIHSFSNDPRIEVKIGAEMFETKESIKVYKYTESSYPFDKIKDIEKQKKEILLKNQTRPREKKISQKLMILQQNTLKNNHSKGIKDILNQPLTSPSPEKRENPPQRKGKNRAEINSNLGALGLLAKRSSLHQFSQKQHVNYYFPQPKRAEIDCNLPFNQDGLKSVKKLKSERPAEKIEKPKTESIFGSESWNESQNHTELGKSLFLSGSYTGKELKTEVEEERAIKLNFAVNLSKRREKDKKAESLSDSNDCLKKSDELPKGRRISDPSISISYYHGVYRDELSELINLFDKDPIRRAEFESQDRNFLTFLHKFEDFFQSFIRKARPSLTAFITWREFIYQYFRSGVDSINRSLKQIPLKQFIELTMKLPKRVKKTQKDLNQAPPDILNDTSTSNSKEKEKGEKSKKKRGKTRRKNKEFLPITDHLDTNYKYSIGSNFYFRRNWSNDILIRVITNKLDPKSIKNVKQMLFDLKTPTQCMALHTVFTQKFITCHLSTCLKQMNMSIDHQARVRANLIFKIDISNISMIKWRELLYSLSYTEEELCYIRSIIKNGFAELGLIAEWNTFMNVYTKSDRFRYFKVHEEHLFQLKLVQREPEDANVKDNSFIDLRSNFSFFSTEEDMTNLGCVPGSRSRLNSFSDTRSYRGQLSGLEQFNFF